MNQNSQQNVGTDPAALSTLAARILRASGTNPEFESAAGHLRAAMACATLHEGFDPAAQAPEQQAMLLASLGLDFGDAGEIGGVNVYIADGESWVLWLCNPTVSTWVTVGDLLNEIEGTLLIEDWYGEPWNCSADTPAQSNSSEASALVPQEPFPPLQGGFGNISAEQFK